jgi:hypothetical protein
MTNATPCGCKTYREGKDTVREVCARHMHNSDGTPLIKLAEPVTEAPHLGREVEKIKPKKVKR